MFLVLFAQFVMTFINELLQKKQLFFSISQMVIGDFMPILNPKSPKGGPFEKLKSKVAFVLKFINKCHDKLSKQYQKH